MPRWDLSSLFSGFDDPAYAASKERLAAEAAALESRFSSVERGGAFRAWLLESLELMDGASALAGSLNSYCYAVFSTDTRDARATAELNAVEDLLLPLKRASVAFRNRLKDAQEELKPLLASDPALADWRFILEEELQAQERQMSPQMEDLAADLSRSGADAWGRLQESVSSTVSALWDEATRERKTVVELRNLAFDPDRSIREKAFRKELDCWASMEIPLAAALNGVKGTNVSLDRRRGWASALDRAAFQSRMERATLDALIDALERSQGLFRRYLAAKARLLGLPEGRACAFYDLFAPVGSSSKSWPWEESKAFILERFSSFDPAMGAFARRAFERNWIDAQPREGKVGGAYCTDFPTIGESRILCNYESSFNSLTTVAHELGHAWHHDCVKDLPVGQADYPMTLAETASIFAETVVFEDALAICPLEDRLALTELRLRDACQVLTDILSRFYFEREVFERRSSRELMPSELCDIMVEAQKRTYGTGLDPTALHPYMWAVKGHYYYAGLSFYNYPYAFGQLFGLALYARFRKEGPSFAAAYRNILKQTGRASCETVAAAAGFDIKKPEFWLSGMSVFEPEVAELEKAAGIGS